MHFIKIMVTLPMTLGNL